MLYVSCGETQQIVRFEMDDATGALRRTGETRLPGAPTPANAGNATAAPELRSNGAPLRSHPDGTVLYAATRTEPYRALSYRISPDTGDLTLIGGAAIEPGTPWIATDRAGRYLIGAAYHANAVWVSRIEEDGVVRAAPVQTIDQLGTTHCVVVHAGNSVAYVASTGLPAIQIFPLGDGDAPLGERHDAIIAAPDATPRHVALRPDQRFLYCMNETSSVVDVFAIGERGLELTPVQSHDLRPAAARGAHGLGADILVSADGKTLYCTERMRGTVSVLAIDPGSGRLAPVQTLALGRIPRSIALDPSGRFLASAIQGDGVVRVHAVAPGDGSLTHCATYETGGTPIWVEFVSLAQ